MTVPDDATQRQIDAADPAQSTWVSANAGSGKTRVLIDRVARLLLAGADPQNILCLTYTKAAAAEMQNRLFRRLGAWAMMEAGALRDELRALGVTELIGPARMAEARRHFARAIETPGGLRIQTIHAFCAGILRRFPLEAGVSPQFVEMEDRAAELLRAEVLDDLSEQRPDLVDRLAMEFSGADLASLTAEIAGHRTVFLSPPDEPALRDLFGLSLDATREDALRLAFDGSEESLVAEMVEICRDQSKTYRTLAATLAGLNFDAPGWDDFDTIRGALLYADKTSKSRNFPQNNHKKAVEAFAPIVEACHDWMDRTAAAWTHLLAFDALERTRTLIEFGRAFVPAYEERKLARGLLDFDDLILRTRRLLSESSVAQWVLYRLDGGIDHVLVDEAQDTSPAQWDVIEALAREFTAGEGARDGARTLFVVGDKKQSIYSFQGADAEAFDAMRDHFAEALNRTGERLEVMPLEYSFRSAEAILRLVDRTFTGPLAEGLEREVFHRAFKRDMPGRVDLWPVVEKTKEDEEDRPWHAPVDTVGAKHHDVVLAERIAGEIHRMIREETLPEKADGRYRRRPITAGDFLILVQRRSGLFAEIIRACKAAGLQVAGADRLKVGAELAVRDLAALLSFLALPEDDLSLAAALKSPLFGWSEQQLFTLAHHRPGDAYLWQALRDRDDAHPEALEILRDLRAQADFLRPYDLLARILVRHGGRKRLLDRLGAEAEDGIDALLAQALAYERSAVPSLTGFLSWMQTEEVEIKRQLDAAGDRIRVMTVHGAKGLEAPIVILPDTCARKREIRSDLWAEGGRVIWGTRAAQTPPKLAEVKDRLLDAQDRERRRLLYVAMTRAENWLIVCGAGDAGDGDQSWYRMVEAGMGRDGALAAEMPGGEGLRILHGDWAALPPAPVVPVATKPVVAPDFPPVDAAPRPPGTLSPSDLGGAKVLPGDPSGGDLEAALERGMLVHRLLEHLPAHAQDQWPAVAATLAEGAEPGDLLDHARRILRAPALRPLFGPDALAEVPVSAALDELDGHRIHGAIDRLIVGERILAVDFKTNRLVPDRPEDTPEGLLRQMGAYRAALAQVFPGRPIATAILWTEAAALMELPDPLVMAALRRAHVA